MERGGEEGGGEGGEVEARGGGGGGEEEDKRWKGGGGGKDFEEEEGGGRGEKACPVIHTGLPVTDWIQHRFRCILDFFSALVFFLSLEAVKTYWNHHEEI